MESRYYQDLKWSLNLGHEARSRHFCPNAHAGEASAGLTSTYAHNETFRRSGSCACASGACPVAAERMEIQMATEQLEAEVGKRYWGAKCPECGTMTAHAPESEKPGEAQVTMTCPNGHRFSARTEELLHFEWGAQ